jgi:hypothetical protein
MHFLFSSPARKRGKNRGDDDAFFPDLCECFTDFVGSWFSGDHDIDIDLD